MKRTPKQDELFKAYQSGKFSFYALGGGTGSSKTFGILTLINAICELVPGVRIAIYRKSEKNLKNNTIPSYRKVLDALGKSVPIVDMKAKYPNGSEILFLWADITKDPDCDNAKGGEFTMAFLNEANQIDPRYFAILKTRVGRWNKLKYNDKTIEVKPCIFLDFNPTDNWVKDQFYNPYRDGTLPVDTFFQLSLPSDNPFNSKEYMEMLETLPEAEYNRYVKGNWDYGDDPNQLIKYEFLKDNLVLPRSTADRLGIDVAREGDDKSVLSFVDGTEQTGLEILNTQDVITVGDLAINRMIEKGIGAKNTSCDVIGVGGGTVDYMRARGYQINAYNSGNSPDVQNKNIGGQQIKSFLQYRNRRAQDYWSLRERLLANEIKILNHADLIKELTSIKYFVKDKFIQIQAKAEIKKTLGKSPDLADATCISFSDFKSSRFGFAIG